MKNLRVTVDGRTFNVSVEILDEPSAAPASLRPVTPPAPVGAPAPAPTAAPSAGAPGEVMSPMAGKIVSIDVKLGQEVEEGAQVATIEAMKMNTYVFAPRAGRVTAVVATVGSATEEGRPLLVIS